jgi:hypothetical protein
MDNGCMRIPAVHALVGSRSNRLSVDQESLRNHGGAQIWRKIELLFAQGSTMSVPMSAKETMPRRLFRKISELI